MTDEPMHPELRDALAAEAVDALDGEERERLLAHLAGCEPCRAELAALRESAAALALAAPARPMEPARAGRLRDRLLARAAAGRPAASADGDDVTLVAPPASDASAGPGDDVTMIAPPPSEPPARAADDVAAIVRPPSEPSATPADDITAIAPPPSVTANPQVIPITAARRRSTLVPWLAAAASLVLLLAAAAYAASLRGRLRSLEEQVAAAERERGELARRMREREATLAAISAPSARVIEMAAAQPAAPSGRMFWDPATNRWTFFAHNLPAVRAGREYQLWLVTADDRKISAGTFRPDPSGHAVVQATYALPADALAAVAVTEEPAGGLPQPSGPIIIAGAASTE
ncbi:MAG TPA: anti-sigma factor [Longimicrobium sp.]|nr:anti-sigma factor [Longimicrobium sp.]